LLRGNGWTPYYVEGTSPTLMHEAMATTLDRREEIHRIQHDARSNGQPQRPRWPMIVLDRPRAGPGQNGSMACKSRAPSARIRCRSPIPRRIPNI
jgi:phosphoketolase